MVQDSTNEGLRDRPSADQDITPTIVKPENLSTTLEDYLSKTVKVDVGKRPGATTELS